MDYQVSEEKLITDKHHRYIFSLSKLVLKLGFWGSGKAIKTANSSV